MRILLDTQCWLWLTSAPERFRPEWRERVASPDTDLFLSAASAWEIVIKWALGKLSLPIGPAEYIPSRLAATRTASLAVQVSHVLQVASLPPHHRDPFDRLLIAQAQVERLPILTADRQFDAYDAEVLRAG